jgi:hypothetical protein
MGASQRGRTTHTTPSYLSLFYLSKVREEIKSLGVVVWTFAFPKLPYAHGPPQSPCSKTECASRFEFIIVVAVGNVR